MYLTMPAPVGILYAGGLAPVACLPPVGGRRDLHCTRRGRGGDRGGGGGREGGSEGGKMIVYRYVVLVMQDNVVVMATHTRW